MGLRSRRFFRENHQITIVTSFYPLSTRPPPWQAYHDRSDSATDVGFEPARITLAPYIPRNDGIYPENEGRGRSPASDATGHALRLQTRVH